MKRLLQLVCFSFLLIVLILGNCTNSYAEKKNTNYPSDKELFTKDMCVDEYNIKMTVNNDGTIDVIEKITVFFLKGTHYFTRTIPIEYNRLYKTTTYSGYANVSNIKVNTECDKNYTTDVYGNSILQLSLKNLTENEAGRQTINLSYTYKLLSKPIEEIDELYFDIIDPFVNCHIGNISFEIKMPKEFDKKNIIFSNSSFASLSDEITYKIKKNTITGTYNKVLTPETGLNIELDLTKNYFDFKKNIPVFIDFFIIIIPLIAFIIALSMWINNNKTIQIAEPLTFYPPKGFNNAEVGIMYKGKTSPSDIASLILYLANKRYIAIMDNEKSKRHYTFGILRPYNDNNLIEKKLLDGLIKYSNEEHIVSISDLKDKFFDIVDDISDVLDNGQIRKNMFSKYVNGQITILVGLIISLVPIYLIPAVFGLGANGILPSLLVVLLSSLLYFVTKQFIKSRTIQAVLNCIITGVSFFIAIFFVNIPYDMIFRARLTYPILIPIALLLVICTGIILGYTTERNKLGTIMLNQLHDFKKNLVQAEELDLAALLQDNNNYFYEILPYSYTLDFNVQWVKQFKTIEMAAPPWFISEREFDLETFANGLNRTINATAEAINSVPRSLEHTRKRTQK